MQKDHRTPAIHTYIHAYIHTYIHTVHTILLSVLQQHNCLFYSIYHRHLACPTGCPSSYLVVLYVQQHIINPEHKLTIYFPQISSPGHQSSPPVQSIGPVQRLYTPHTTPYFYIYTPKKCNSLLHSTYIGACYHCVCT